MLLEIQPLTNQFNGMWTVSPGTGQWVPRPANPNVHIPMILLVSNTDPVRTCSPRFSEVVANHHPEMGCGVGSGLEFDKHPVAVFYAREHVETRVPVESAKIDVSVPTL